MQRTGTTFLQYNVFPFIKEVNLVDFNRKDGGVDGDYEIKNFLINIEDYDKSFFGDKVYSHFREDKINLISEENIYCEMFSKEDKRLLKIKKIKEFFPDAKIIFSVRKPERLMVSWYVKYVMKGGVLCFRDYLEKIENVDKFNYEFYIDLLYGLFGESNVYTYALEDLKRDPENIIKDICDFIGVDVPSFSLEKRNVSYSLGQLKISLILNRLFKTPLNKNGLISVHEGHIPHRYIFNRNFFQQLNRRKILIEDLKELDI